MGFSRKGILEWVVSFSRGSSWPRDWTLVSCIPYSFQETLKGILWSSVITEIKQADAKHKKQALHLLPSSWSWRHQIKGWIWDSLHLKSSSPRLASGFYTPTLPLGPALSHMATSTWLIAAAFSGKVNLSLNPSSTSQPYHIVLYHLLLLYSCLVVKSCLSLL